MDVQSGLGMGELRRAVPSPPDAVSRGIRSLAIGLYAVQAAIAIVNLTPIIDHGVLGQILDVNREDTAVVWLTSTMLWTVALLAVYAAASMRSVGSTRRAWLGWLVIGAGFALLSVDETALLHERAGDKVSEFITIPGLPDLYAWVLVVAPIALLGTLWMLRWLASTVGLGSTTTRLAIAAAGLWVLVPVFESLDPTLGAPRLLIVAEETCETVGITLFLTGMLVFLRDRGWLRLPTGSGGA